MNPDRSDVFFKVLPGASPDVYCGQLEELTLFYAPGYLAAAAEREAAEITGILRGELPFGKDRTAHYLTYAALSARETLRMAQDPARYKPVCLTLYTTLKCGLSCSYCFSRKAREEDLLLDEAFIFKTGRDVIENCRAAGEPFTLVFHGGGEPSMDPRLPFIFETLKKMCTNAGVPFRSYIATNGVMPRQTAVWIAENIDEIGLSVDGPPEIQDSQRPLFDLGKSSGPVEKTAEVFREHQKSFTARVTILPENYHRMAEIADYLLQRLRAETVHIEPVYARGNISVSEAADAFCGHFLALKQLLGEKLPFSGSRIREVHGRYCSVFRQTAQAVPEKGLSACFALSSRSEADREGLLVRQGNLQDLFDRLSVEDPACGTCFARYHCARGCPDVCPALTPGPRDAGSFRCRISRTLAEAELLDAAEKQLVPFARQYGAAGMRLREG